MNDVDGGLALLDQHVAGDHLGAFGEDLLDPRRHRCRVDAFLDGDVDAVGSSIVTCCAVARSHAARVAPANPSLSPSPTRR